jgi:hypothetical protein
MKHDLYRIEFYIGAELVTRIISECGLHKFNSPERKKFKVGDRVEMVNVHLLNQPNSIHSVYAPHKGKKGVITAVRFSNWDYTYLYFIEFDNESEPFESPCFDWRFNKISVPKKTVKKRALKVGDRVRATRVIKFIEQSFNKGSKGIVINADSGSPTGYYVIFDKAFNRRTDLKDERRNILVPALEYTLCWDCELERI